MCFFILCLIPKRLCSPLCLFIWHCEMSLATLALPNQRKQFLAVGPGIMDITREKQPWVCDPVFPVLLCGVISNDPDAWSVTLFVCSDPYLHLDDAVSLTCWTMTGIPKAQALQSNGAWYTSCLLSWLLCSHC